MDIGYFRIDFQVNHQFRHARTGRRIFVFKNTVREMVAQGVIMRSTSLSPKEYRDFAAQCLRWAARAKGQV
jgi:hypothetical protein